MIRLINAPPSPFGRKVAIALREKNIPFETVWEQPWNEGTIVGDYNPLAQLPILIADDGEVGYDSNYLLEWIERRYPEPPLLPGDDDSILRAKQLMLLADAIMDSAAMVIRELSRPPSNEAWIARFRHKITRAGEALNDAVAGREFALGDRFSQADIAIVVNLRMLDALTEWYGTPIEVARWCDRLPDLAAYVARIDERPAFVATRPQPMAHEGPVYS
jgi:glutathione S-transferase